MPKGVQEKSESGTEILNHVCPSLDIWQVLSKMFKNRSSDYPQISVWGPGQTSRHQTSLSRPLISQMFERKRQSNDSWPVLIIRQTSEMGSGPTSIIQLWSVCVGRSDCLYLPSGINSIFSLQWHVPISVCLQPSPTFKCSTDASPEDMLRKFEESCEGEIFRLDWEETQKWLLVVTHTRAHKRPE